jgi:hypothetical protein
MIKFSARIAKVIFLILIISWVHGIMAQENRRETKDKKTFIDRVSIGGALGFGFGSNSILVDVSPIIGYSLTDNFVVGLGLTYKYYQYNDFYQSTSDLTSFSDLKNNIYGGSIFARYFLTGIGIPVIENMFIHAEVEPLIYTSDFKYISNKYGDYYGADGAFYNKEKEQITITSYFLGGGLRQMITDRSYLYIEVLWNFNEELYSPYSNPRIRIGFAAGF